MFGRKKREIARLEAEVGRLELNRMYLGDLLETYRASQPDWNNPQALLKRLSELTNGRK